MFSPSDCTYTQADDTCKYHISVSQFYGTLVLLYPFWAPSQPTDAESRTTLLLDSSSIGLCVEPA